MNYTHDSEINVGVTPGTLFLPSGTFFLLV